MARGCRLNSLLPGPKKPDPHSPRRPSPELVKPLSTALPSRACTVLGTPGSNDLWTGITDGAAAPSGGPRRAGLGAGRQCGTRVRGHGPRCGGSPGCPVAGLVPEVGMWGPAHTGHVHAPGIFRGGTECEWSQCVGVAAAWPGSLREKQAGVVAQDVPLGCPTFLCPFICWPLTYDVPSRGHGPTALSSKSSHWWAFPRLDGGSGV